MNESDELNGKRNIVDLITYFDSISCEIDAGKLRNTKANWTYINKNVCQKNSFKKICKSSKIIEELLNTEETYFQTLRHIIGSYIFYFKQELNENIFKTLEELGRHQVTFYVDLLDNRKDAEKIAQCFLKHKQLFYYYKIYISEMYDLFNTLSTKYKKLVEYSCLITLPS
ncbi:pleckstrin homology domain-containing family G member 1-like isoform X2 [Onthophagus taurus]|uniref:pleckstrin homology domain-containing family G member 1-like isoform X2 n=1 Tax=Onthophagus taurus TaxID=166361 RepID=UPI0039BDB95B